MACTCIHCQREAKTVDQRRGDIERAVSDASNFLRAQRLMPDNDGTNQIVRTVLYGLAVENWRVTRNSPE